MDDQYGMDKSSRVWYEVEGRQGCLANFLIELHLPRRDCILDEESIKGLTTNPFVIDS